MSAVGNKTVMVRKPERKRPLVRCSSIYRDNINMISHRQDGCG